MSFYIGLEEQNISKVLTSNLNYKKADNMDALMLLRKLFNAFERFETNIERYYYNELGGSNSHIEGVLEKCSNIVEHVVDFYNFFNELVGNEYDKYTEEQKKELDNKYSLMTKEIDNEYCEILADRYSDIIDEEPKTANRKILFKWAEDSEPTQKT